MDNNLWSYETPTEEGFYLFNLGDVVTPANFAQIRLIKMDGVLMDAEGIDIAKYNRSWKWIKLDLNELNLRGNRD